MSNESKLYFVDGKPLMLLDLPFALELACEAALDKLL